MNSLDAAFDLWAPRFTLCLGVGHHSSVQSNCGTVMTPSRSNAAKAFIDFVDDSTFPCVGAKAAVSCGGLDIMTAGDLCAADFDDAILQRVEIFVEGLSAQRLFTSFAVTFPDTPLLSETQFEQRLWQRLQAIHELDAQKHVWDPAVSSDPGSPAFGMSVAGHGFYVIGVHPGASRPARRFHHAALVFNLHSQFERLRSQGRYEKLKTAIADRDRALSGSNNRMLAVHGVISEAPQYSGRVVGDDWQCPFNPRMPASS